MTKGRRTNVLIQKDVAIDEDGMENLDAFWGAAGQADVSLSGPSLLFEQTPPPSPTFQTESFERSSTKKSPSAVTLSPSSAPTPIGLPPKRLEFGTPSKTPPRANERDHTRITRTAASPAPDTIAFLNALNANKSAEGVKLPIITPAKPAPPKLRPKPQPAPQAQAPAPAKVVTPKKPQNSDTNVPEVRFDTKTPEVFRRLNRELDADATYEVRPAFQRNRRFDNDTTQEWRVWRPPEEVEMPRRFPLFADSGPEAKPERKPDKVEFNAPNFGRTDIDSRNSRKSRLDSDFQFGTYNTGPIFAPFAKETASNDKPKHIRFDQIPGLSSDSDFDSDSDPPEPRLQRKPPRVTFDIKMEEPEPARVTRVNRLSRMKESPKQPSYLQPTRLNVFHTDPEPSDSDEGSPVVNPVSGSIFTRPSPKPEFVEPEKDEVAKPAEKTGFFGVLRQTANVASQVSREHTPAKATGFFPSAAAPKFEPVETKPQRMTKIDNAEQIDIPPTEQPVRYVFGPGMSESDHEEVELPRKGEYQSIRPELPVMEKFNFHMGSTASQEALSSQEKVSKSALNSRVPATPTFEASEPRRRRHRRRNTETETLPENEDKVNDTKASKAIPMTPPMSDNASDLPVFSGDQSPEVLRNSPSPQRPLFDSFEPELFMGEGDADEYERMVADVDSPPPMPAPALKSPVKSPAKAPTPEKKPAPAPRQRGGGRRRRQVETIDYSQMDDIDQPIAVRRTKRPHTKPLKFWKGEKIIYHCDENGLLTQQGVHLVEDDDEVPLRRSRPARRNAQSKPEAPSEIEVLPRRVVPGEADDVRVKYTGLANRVMTTDEYEILPKQSMTFKASKQRMMLYVSQGKAKLVSNSKKWVIATGGMIYISKGDSCRITNKSATEPVRLFETSM